MIHLHLHTSRGSLLDSILEVKEAVQFAKDNGYSAIGLSDHGSMASFVEWFKECKKQGIKPILGCEVYETDDMYAKTETKDNKLPRYHLVLHAKNEKGLNNLFKIISAGYLDGFYIKPRIDLEYIERNNLGEGIVCLTACMAGRFSRMAQGKATDKYKPKEYIQKLNSIFDYVALEIQSHDSEEQIEINKKIVSFAKKFNYPFVVTSDAHMLKKEQQEAHGIFVQIGTAREVGETYEGCYLQTTKEVHEHLDKHLGEDVVNQAIAETYKIADMIEEFEIGLNNDNLMPEIKIPDGYNTNIEYFRSIINENFPIKFGHLSKEEQDIRRERIEMEIPVLEALGYIDYFLMLNKLTTEAKRRKIPLGYSRGSGANCLCLFMMNVTQIDSVRWNLDFSRFANLGRKSVADYDMDIAQARRKEMVSVSEDMFGQPKVAPICTFGLLSTKVAIKDIGKVLNERGVYDIPYSLRDEVAKLIPTIKTLNDLGEEEEKETLLKDVLLVNERLKEVHEQYPLWFKYVMELEGKPKSLGQHACFDKDTLITTTGGLKRIEDIEVGDLVLTHKKRFMPVVDTMTTETNEVYFVKTASSFPVEVTHNHPFYVRDMKYKRLRSHKDGIDTKVKTFGEPYWCQVSDLKIGEHYVGIPVNEEEIIPFYNDIKLPFDNKNFWWIVGRFIGDGWLENPTRKGKTKDWINKRVIICCSKVTDNELNDIKLRLDRLYFDYRVECTRTNYKIYINNCNDLYDYLSLFGRYAHGKFVYGDVINLPAHLSEEFLNGYISADGHYDKNKNSYSIKTVSKNLAIGVMQLVNKVYKRHASIVVVNGKIETIERRVVTSKVKYQVCFTKDVRQKEQSFYENGYIWTRVSKIEKENTPKKMFNLTVLNDSSYVAHGLAVHNCGTIIAPQQLTNYTPLCLNKDGQQMLQLEMHNAMDDLHLCKMDFLGLVTLDIVDDCLKMAGLTWDDVDINHLNLDDKDVFDNIYKNGNTVGIFQMESHEAISLCIEAKVDNIEDVIAINAFNRPGTKSGFPTYVKNKQNPESATLIHEDLRPIFETTNLVLLYQEQALQIFRLAGFDETEVDNARRCLDGNSNVLMGDGTSKKLKDVCVGDVVVSYNNNGKAQLKEVTNKWNNGERQTYKVEAQHGYEVVATEDHEILTQRGWVQVQDLTESDFIMSPKKIPTINDNKRPNQRMSETDAFLLGMLIGDGTLGGSSISFTNSDIEVVNKFKDCVTKRLRGNDRVCEFIVSEQSGVEVETIYNVRPKDDNFRKSLDAFVKKHDLRHNASNKKVPVEIMSYPKGSKLQNFIGGLFSTDGGYRMKQGHIEYYSISKELIYQLKHLLLKFGIYSIVSNKFVKDYNYYTYTLYISQIDSLIAFEKEILPFVVGKKADEFKHIIESAKNNPNKYNYLLPKEYTDEMINSSLESEISISEIGRKIGGYTDGGFKLLPNSTTDTKAREFVKYTYCPETYKLLMSDYIPVKVKSITKMDVITVYDIEVADNHNFVANGVVVHNCIGKKLPDEMRALKGKFHDGLKARGWEDWQINEVWILMEKQAEYSFNRGHSVAYGLLSYLTAYLKHYYPVEFMTACLNYNMSNTSKTGILLNECKRLGIKVSPPHINKSLMLYTPNPKNKEILFGLNPIKGLGEVASQFIIDNRPYSGLDDFFNKMTQQNSPVNKSAIVTLIKAGCLPVKDKNVALIKYCEYLFKTTPYKPVKTLPPKLKLINEWGIDPDVVTDKDERLRLYNEKKELLHNELLEKKFIKHKKEFFDKYVGDSSLYEFETLGMFLTNNPFDNLSIKLPKFDDVNDGQDCVVVSSVVEVKRKKDKRNNQYAYLDLFTTSGIIEGIAFATAYGTYSQLLTKGSHIVILGKKSEDKLMVRKVKSLEQWKKDVELKQ